MYIFYETRWYEVPIPKTISPGIISYYGVYMYTHKIQNQTEGVSINYNKCFSIYKLISEESVLSLILWQSHSSTDID